MSKLHEIAKRRREHVAVLKKEVPLVKLQEKIKNLSEVPLNLEDRVKQNPPIDGAKFHLAAEFKRASPSKGVMAAENLKLEDQIATYVRACSSIISVLTEPEFFKGSLEDMELAKKTILTLNPSVRPLVLRKDFIIDSYQLYEARAFGADTVLLIVAILSDEELKTLIDESRMLGMEPLVEAANENETKRALESGARVLGVNNRDLTTFKVDLSTTNRCAALVDPKSEISILALSGIKSREDVLLYENLEVVRGILVGEHLMRSDNPIREIRGLVVSEQNLKPEKPLIKICGIVRAEDAIVACQSKVNLIGLIFAEKSPRKVDVEQAKQIVRVVQDFRETKTAIKIDLPLTSAIDLKRMKLSTEWFTEAARNLRQACSRGPLTVGVFMNQPMDKINEIVSLVGLDLVQLHGDEAWEECLSCIVPVIRVVHIPANEDLTDENITKSAKPGFAIAILLDTTLKKGTASGGTGIAFDWTIAAKYKKLGIPVIVAGGLNEENIEEAIKRSDNPLGVDCSSGVQNNETTPREKDPSKIKNFVRLANS